MEGSQSNIRARRRWAWAVRGASGLAVASAVSAATAADGPRAAVLLPPRVGSPTPVVVARGAIDDNPLATTPVVRKSAPAATRPLVPPTGAKAAPAPDWLSGVDPNVIPAGGNVPAKAATPVRLTAETRPTAVPAPQPGSTKLTPPPPLFQPGEPRPLAKGVEALKGTVSPESPPAHAVAQQAEPRSASEPLQGTAANGAPVLAGPPAWRWYGYGSVTPGANAYAPTGQYPRASANWYSVTRATPGAFPVPVVNPFRGGPGAEPPSYAGAAPAPSRSPAPQAMAENMGIPQSRYAPTPAPGPVTAPTGGTKFGPVPTTEPAAVMPPPVLSIPTLPPVPTLAPVAVAPPALAPIPLPPPPLLTPPPATKAPEPVAVAPLPLPTAEPSMAAPRVAPPALPPLSVMPLSVMPATTAPAPTAPAPTPVAAVPPLPTVPAVAPVVTPAAGEGGNEIRWQSNPAHRPATAPGTWLPPAERARPTGQPGASAEPRAPIARGQAGDDRPQPTDPVAALVEAVCRGRATEIDVRHTGPRRVTVCFEARTQTDATAVVRDLSARPELAPYEVNFCVLVK